MYINFMRLILDGFVMYFLSLMSIENLLHAFIVALLFQNNGRAVSMCILDMQSS